MSLVGTMIRVCFHRQQHGLRLECCEMGLRKHQARRLLGIHLLPCTSAALPPPGAGGEGGHLCQWRIPVDLALPFLAPKDCNVRRTHTALSKI